MKKLLLADRSMRSVFEGLWDMPDYPTISIQVSPGSLGEGDTVKDMAGGDIYVVKRVKKLGRGLYEVSSIDGRRWIYDSNDKLKLLG